MSQRLYHGARRWAARITRLLLLFAGIGPPSPPPPPPLLPAVYLPAVHVDAPMPPGATQQPQDAP